MLFNKYNKRLKYAFVKVNQMRTKVIGKEYDIQQSIYNKMYYDDYNKFTQMLNITPALTTVEENG